MFLGPISRCCEGMDFTWSTQGPRQVAVCIACEKVFYDRTGPKPGLLTRLTEWANPQRFFQILTEA